jgi:acetyl esterase
MTAYILDSALQAYLDASALITPTDDSLEARRHAFAKACRYFTPAKPEGLQIDDQVVDGLRIRLYRPMQEKPPGGWPTVLYLHGGGWNMGDHQTHDWFVFALAKRLQIAVIAVDYRLAPEHPFPAPLDDALKIWLTLRGGYWQGLSRERLAVAGDSAGGSLAAGLCVALRQQGLPQPRMQALACPVLSARADFASMNEHAHAPMLTTTGLMLSLDDYVPDRISREDSRALALELEDFSGLADAFVGVAQFDPLFDQGRAYAQALTQAGVPASFHVGEKLVHASLRASGVIEVERFYDAMADGLRAALG